ncbi:MAG: hypothetical protein ACW99G_03675 [Candidatus Thorarchaeota archaeon]|jgi:hypothetical protein
MDQFIYLLCVFCFSLVAVQIIIMGICALDDTPGTGLDWKEYICMSLCMGLFLAIVSASITFASNFAYENVKPEPKPVPVQSDWDWVESDSPSKTVLQNNLGEQDKLSPIENYKQ